MKENKENVKVLTSEDILRLSNNQKRLDFLNDYESWGTWLEIPEINVKVFKAELPNEEVIFVTEFNRDSVMTGEIKSAAYRYGKDCEDYRRYPENVSSIAERLKNLKMKILKEKK